MASDKKDTSKDTKKGYEPKATARHAKKTQTKKEEIEAAKKKIDTDKHLAKKYESNRKTEIKALPKEERSAAKAELKESKEKRKEAESKDREKLRVLIEEERAEKGKAEKESFDEESWLQGGRKKRKEKETPAAQPNPEPAVEVPDTEPPAEEPAPQPETAAGQDRHT